MSAYVFAAELYKPTSSTAIRVESMIIALGTMTQSIAGASDLFAFEAGDLEVTADDRTGFWTDLVKYTATDPTTLTSVTARFQIDIREQSSGRIFRGFLLPQSIVLDPKEKIATFTLLGPMVLLDQTNAEDVRRVFPEIRAVVPTGGTKILKGSFTVPINCIPSELIPGDEVSFSGSNQTYRVAGVGPNTATTDITDGLLTLDEGLRDDVANNTPIEVATPYFRNRTIDDLADQLFRKAGINSYTIDYSGRVSPRPFIQSFNTGPATGNSYGLDGFGSVRGMRAAYANEGTTGNPPKLYVTMENDLRADETGVRLSAQPQDGFSSAGRTPGYASDHGADFDFYDYGDPAIGGPAGCGYIFHSTNNLRKAFRSRMDSVTKTGGLGYTHDITRKTFALSAWQSGTDQTRVRMYELRARRIYSDVNYDPADENPRKGNVPNIFEEGTPEGQWIELYRYTTSDYGLGSAPSTSGWAVDTAWYAPTSSPTVTPSAGGSKYYNYYVVAKDLTGMFLSVSLAGIASACEEPGVSSATIAVSWGAISGASTYDLHRVEYTAASVAVTTRSTIVAESLSATSWTDNGSSDGSGHVPNPYCFSFLRYQATPVLEYDFCISSLPWVATESSNDACLIVSAISSVMLLRIDTVGGVQKVIEKRVLHSNAGGSKAMVINNPIDTVGGYPVIHLYWFDVASNSIVHDYAWTNLASGWAPNSSVTSFTSAEAIALGDYKVSFKTMKWNGAAGNDSRIGLIYSSASKGTGYAILTPGNSNLTGAASTFLVESSGVLSPTFVHEFPGCTIGTGYTKQVTHGTLAVDGAGLPAYPYFPRDNAPMFLASWWISTGPSDTTGKPFFVGYAAHRWFLVSQYSTGFISYADFEGMSVSEALRELAFCVNANVSVEWDTPGSPYGYFVSRDRTKDSTRPEYLLRKLSGGAPVAGDPGWTYTPLRCPILEQQESRVWEFTVPQVTVNGGAEDVTATAGSLNYRQDGLSVDAKFVADDDYASVLADGLLAYYGPSIPVANAPSVRATGTPGSSTWAYVVVTVNSGGSVIAASRETRITNGNTSTATTQCQISWGSIPNAFRYYVYRTAAPGSEGIGRLLSSVLAPTTSFLDNTNSLALNEAPPSGLRNPRKSAEITVQDFGVTLYVGDVVRFPDTLATPDPATPSLPLAWVIQSIERNPTEPTMKLSVVQRDVT